jgi:hypothetical protein
MRRVAWTCLVATLTRLYTLTRAVVVIAHRKQRKHSYEKGNPTSQVPVVDILVILGEVVAAVRSKVVVRKIRHVAFTDVVYSITCVLIISLLAIRVHGAFFILSHERYNGERGDDDERHDNDGGFCLELCGAVQHFL